MPEHLNLLPPHRDVSIDGDDVDHLLDSFGDRLDVLFQLAAHADEQVRRPGEKMDPIARGVLWLARDWQRLLEDLAVALPNAADRGWIRGSKAHAEREAADV